jgi:hypothetical protein
MASVVVSLARRGGSNNNDDDVSGGTRVEKRRNAVTITKRGRRGGRRVAAKRAKIGEGAAPNPTQEIVETTPTGRVPTSDMPVEDRIVFSLDDLVRANRYRSKLIVDVRVCTKDRK